MSQNLLEVKGQFRHVIAVLRNWNSGWEVVTSVDNRDLAVQMYVNVKALCMHRGVGLVDTLGEDGVYAHQGDKEGDY